MVERQGLYAFAAFLFETLHRKLFRSSIKCTSISIAFSVPSIFLALIGKKETTIFMNNNGTTINIRAKTVGILYIKSRNKN